MTDYHSKNRSLTATLLLSASLLSGCAGTTGSPSLSLPFTMPWTMPWTKSEVEAPPKPEPAEVCLVEKALADAEQAQIFRRAETERAENLTREIDRLQADLKTAEAALVEAESGLSGSHTRAEAISSLAGTRIQVERANSRAPWRAEEIESAREKLAEAERQVGDGHFGAAIFFVYRARRVAESVLEEADFVMESAYARLIRAERVNLRSGPSTKNRILSVLDSGTPVIPQTNDGDWMLVQVTGGPAGWVHRRLLGDLVRENDSLPASPRP